jgi:hypothetical protein
MDPIATTPRTRLTPRERLFVGALVAVVGVFFLSSIRDGHEWGDDFALYVRHAQNIVDGRAYGDTGYIYNPEYPEVGPRAYPPALPLLLAPVVAVRGLDFWAMKAVIVLCFLAFLVVLYPALRATAPTHVAMAATATVGLSPYFWSFKEGIVSDIPFLVPLYAALSLAHRCTARDDVNPPLRTFVFLGLVIFITAAFRTVGVVLIPAVLAADLLRTRRIRTGPLVAAAIAGIAIALQSYVVPGNESYFDQFHPTLDRTLLNLRRYGRSINYIWTPGLGPVVSALFTGLLLALSAIGLVARLRRGITVFETFVGVYAPLVVLWPAFQGERFLIPLLPIFVLYFYLGAEVLARRATGGRRPVVTALAILVGLAYVTRYAASDFGPRPDGVLRQEVQEGFEYAKTHTPKDSVIVFRKPRALALFTERRSGTIQSGDDTDAQWAFVDKVGATYLMTRAADDDYIERFLEVYAERLKPLYHNGMVALYRILR